MIGRVDISVGAPTHEGIYAAEVYYGWKILEWYRGEWWFTDRGSKWGAGIPSKWVGPLPAARPANKPAPQEFDL